MVRNLQKPDARIPDVTILSHPDDISPLLVWKWILIGMILDDKKAGRGRPDRLFE
jgi:hypothetical protein